MKKDIGVKFVFCVIIFLLITLSYNEGKRFIKDSFVGFKIPTTYVGERSLMFEDCYCSCMKSYRMNPSDYNEYVRKWIEENTKSR